jgi:lipopolysaccharide/colanic/teichoic acid biosynthesis glycosyltransferase
MGSNSDIARRMVDRDGQRATWLRPVLGRALDVSLAFIALVVFAPMMLIVAILVAAERRGPILFRHTRIGLQGKVFRVLKFRSMHVDGDAILAHYLAANPAAAHEWALDHKLRTDPRVTGLGAFLRKSSLDELPQLFNVLVGDMSIVGPRPIVQSEVARYGRFFTAYCSVRPGITGIWQVSGRNHVSYRRRVLMDALYARRKCVALDIKLMLATIPAVLARKGSY